ncbi:MAG: MFS transporter [Gammaproteobacteria bacterium]|nr:MFS transporter [Gammaproteobacteria bacterium]MBT8444818.1 MFS transporter [Gammaproteobacteria bacterium]NND36381.1 MFS transporter [Gammaproteobacteria bacterium]
MGIGLALRWQIAILLCLITTINYVDRQALAVAAPVIVEKFSLSNTEFGLITSGFLFAYAIGQMLIGPVVDRLGTKRSFRFAVIAWSIAGILHALGRGFWSFFSLRTLLGLTESMNFPAAVKAVAEWFPRSERSLAVGIVTMGPGLGALISPPLLGWLIITFGWQWAFIVPGAAGFVWLLIWQARFDHPEDHPSLSDEERRLIIADREAELSEAGADAPVEAGSRSVLRFFRYREVWGLMFSRFVADGAFYFFVSWLPLYLAQERGFDIKAIAIFAVIPFLAADLGSLFGGWLGTRLIRGGMTVNAARKWVIWIGALLIPCALPAVWTDSAAVSIALIGVAMFAIQVKSSNLFTLPADLFPSGDVATIWGMFGAVGSFGGMLFVALAGWVSENYSYEPIFAAVAVMHIVSAAIVMVMIPNISLLNRK